MVVIGLSDILKQEPQKENINYQSMIWNEDEYILCAAIWYKEIPLVKTIPGVLPKNIDTGLVVTGHRHGQCIWTVVCLAGLRTVEIAEDATGKSIQGFLTNTNRFVDREEGFDIAEASGQLNDRTRGKSRTLYSEDLY